MPVIHRVWLAAVKDVGQAREQDHLAAMGFFASVGIYLDAERPAGIGSPFVFVVLKGPNRGQPLTPKRPGAAEDRRVRAPDIREGVLSSSC